MPVRFGTDLVTKCQYSFQGHWKKLKQSNKYNIWNNSLNLNNLYNELCVMKFKDLVTLNNSLFVCDHLWKSSTIEQINIIIILHYGWNFLQGNNNISWICIILIKPLFILPLYSWYFTFFFSSVDYKNYSKSLFIYNDPLWDWWIN